MTEAAADGGAARTRELAVAMVALAACAFSLNGLVIRQLEGATSWQVVFYRALGLLIGIGTVFAWRHRDRTWQAVRASGRLAVMAAPLQGIGVCLFIYSMTHTTVANTMMMLSATPLFAAVIGWAVLGEKVGWATAAAIAVTIVGIGLMAVDGLASGALLGNMAALGNAFTFAIFIAFLRRGRGVDMVPAVMLGAACGMLIAFVAADDLAAPVHDIVLCILWGAVSQTVGMSLMMAGSRVLPAAEISLIAMIEFVLAPTLAWTVTGELPTPLSATGGAMIFAAMLAWSARRARLRRSVPLRTTGS
ncbi:MAG: DMT family transporter [Alphaproteobacteria bacterium]|nr:DMT family transporter [Alphaproteobacteria bacterium]